MRKFALGLLTTLLLGTQVFAQAPDFEAEIIQKSIAGMNAHLAKFDLDAFFLVRYRALKTTAVPSPTHTMWDVSYDPQGLILTYLYDEDALRSPERIVSDLAVGAVARTLSNVENLWKSIRSFAVPQRLQFWSIQEFAELLVDAQFGSLAARSRLADQAALVTRDLELDDFVKRQFPDLQERINRLRAVRLHEATLLGQQALADRREREKIFARWKAQDLWGRLEQEPQKLNDLLVKNDRAGVAKMIRSYLPWTLMEPVETEFWKTWLDAIEHPDPKNQSVVYRGVGYETDKVQRSQTAAGEALGFLAPLLTKNQGSYTRRLRSLATKRLRTGDLQDLIESKSHADVVRITSQIRAHATKPSASAFLSFTLNPQIARNFIGSNKTVSTGEQVLETPGGGLLIASIDSRRLFTNVASAHPHEMEVLAPLVVFPDEVVAYRESSFAKDVDLQDFVNAARAKKGLEPMSLPLRYSQIRSTLVHGGFDFVKKFITTPGSAGGLCSHVWE